MNTLKFCENNLTDATRQLVKKAKAEFSNVDISIEPCLDHCEECAHSHVALANGQLVTADTADLLFERAKNLIGEREVALPRNR